MAEIWSVIEGKAIGESEADHNQVIMCVFLSLNAKSMRVQKCRKLQKLQKRDQELVVSQTGHHTFNSFFPLNR